MLEKSERVLKIVCLGLAVILLSKVVIAVLRHDPLGQMSIPALPALATAPDAKATKPGTNSVVAGASSKPGTNSIPVTGTEMKSTNSVPGQVSSKAETNVVSAPATGAASTNSSPAPASAMIGTNAIAKAEKKGTNVIAGTNLVAGTNGTLGTNVVLPSALSKQAMNLKARRGPGKQAAELPPVIQARVDKIVDSEILGPVIRPMPMGLLGIAGEYAFLRTPSGQTGLVKEGDELGEIKLIKIGINRVLVEEAGEKKELTIFEGYGSETLLPKPKDKPDEIITKPK